MLSDKRLLLMGADHRQVLACYRISVQKPILTRLAQGAEGTEVSMTVQPRGSDERRQLALTRRKVRFNPVTSRMCGGTPRTGYLRVSTFSLQTAGSVRSALHSLKVRGSSALP